MRLGVIGPIFPDSFAENILDCLPGLGITPVALGPPGPVFGGQFAQYGADALRRLGAEGEQLSQYPLARRARNSKCDVILNLHPSLMPEVIQGLKRTGAKIALWFPDPVSNVGRMSMVTADYDALFLKDRLFVDRLERVYGMNAHYVPEACNTRWHRPVGEPGIDSHIVSVGVMRPTRARLLKMLHADGIPLALYGPGFPRWLEPGPLKDLHRGRYLAREEKARVFRRAAGVLNDLQPSEMHSVNCRLFEATASGGAVLCERRVALVGLFEEKKEVLAFESYDELLGHCRRLLADPRETARLGDAASKRALSEHTYEMRIRQMLDVLG